MFTSVCPRSYNTAYFIDPNIMIQFIQYLLLSPSYINVLNVYAFCNTHDISWGTKGPDVPPPIKGGTVTTVDGKADMNVPTDDKDLDEQYESELRSLAIKPEKEIEKPSETQKQKDYYAGFRSCVVLVWMFTNFALAAGILNSAGLDRMTDNDAAVESERSKVYLAVVLWSVAGLSAFRFLGCSWFLILRLVSLWPPYPCSSLWRSSDSLTLIISSVVFKVDPISPKCKDAWHYCFYVSSIQITWQYSRGFLWPHWSSVAETERADAFSSFSFLPFLSAHFFV